MNSRRSFIKRTGVGAAVTSLLPGQVVAAASWQALQAQQIVGEEIVQFKVKAPLFCPYHSVSTPEEKGGGAHYYRRDSFTHNPFTIRASGMSGSPIIVDAEGRFYGFMTTFGYEASTFQFDGIETLSIQVPNGQELFVEESGNGDLAWKRYNTTMMQRLGVEPLRDHPDFWADVEYCTWVEQKQQATKPRQHFHLLTHDFVKAYLDKVIEYGYPKGKMTLDHGWGRFPDGSIDSGFGSWHPDPEKFPDFRKTMDMIREKGFTPGLWIGFPKIHQESTIAKRRPDLLGSWEDHDLTQDPKKYRYLNPKADIYEYASEVIGRFQEMGVRKFKIDMSYNTKSDMLHIHKELYRAAKNIDQSLEMEFHVPDIFFAKYTDVIRTNDVWLRDEYDWPARVTTHYKVTHQSCPGRGINLDHIGGNDTGAITEKKYLQHLAMYEDKTGYPLVSILPHHISAKCVEKTGEYLHGYVGGQQSILSDFYDAG